MLEELPRPVLEPIRVRSLRDHVHDRLRAAILAGHLRPGERLNERQLAADFGVSTSPLKEALRQLEGEGLVSTSPRRGTFVSFSAAQAEEMTFARAAIESMITRLAARRGSAEDLERLRATVEEMRAAVASSDVDLLVALNEAFHGGIHEASGCDYLRRLQLAQQMYDHASRVTVLSRSDVRLNSFHEHAAIMQAIAARDEDLAERLMKEHVLKAGELYISLVF